MTPDQKSKELIDKMIPYMSGWIKEGVYHREALLGAKQCALICIDEIIKVCPYVDSSIREGIDQLNAYEEQFINCWEDVKSHINNRL